MCWNLHGVLLGLHKHSWVGFGTAGYLCSYSVTVVLCCSVSARCCAGTQVPPDRHAGRGTTPAWLIAYVAVMGLQWQGGLHGFGFAVRLLVCAV